ncbi:MAG: ATP-binding cassette domain-containing protein, partial [Bacteriovorax sp.]
DDKRNNLNASVGEPFKIQAFKVGQKFGSKLIFKDVDFSVSSGEVLLIKGESGAGKSTLLSIILGLKAPAMGEIHINGFSTYGLMPSLRDCVAYVGPEPFLLNETVEHNLLFGHSNRKEVSEKDLWEALSLVGLDSVVKNFSSELNERLTEHSKLSTGERQRLSLARAVLRKPKIFVLDEATANLDFGTEKMIIERLVPMMKRSLTIIVSHKPSFDNLTDKVLVIKS